MALLNRSFFALSFGLLAATLIANAGCSSSPPADPDASGSGAALTQQPAPECAGKACGVDCSHPASDEPFNCNATGQCVSAGHALGCPACPAFLGDCITGTAPADLNGDGCIDGCAAIANTCAGKACGVDCSDPSSDEPFNCNAQGQCVATGNDLGCGGGATGACAGKVCGQSCPPPPGSMVTVPLPDGGTATIPEEPFACNASGQCVYAGENLGCAPPPPPPPPPNPCAGKACGVDCSHPMSDEPFNCNVAGQCVVTGQPLGCN